MVLFKLFSCIMDDEKKCLCHKIKYLIKTTTKSFQTHTNTANPNKKKTEENKNIQPEILKYFNFFFLLYIFKIFEETKIF